MNKCLCIFQKLIKHQSRAYLYNLQKRVIVDENVEKYRPIFSKIHEKNKQNNKSRNV